MPHSIIPPYLAVKAMRDNGYKNAAYAIAELMDNSIQASATTVDLLCGEEDEFLTERTRLRIKQLAVLDNGNGMNSDVLRMALQFGNGTHLNDNSGIGRFGMGLPNSSISQCRRVEVWTWQNGIDSAIYSYLDVDEIEKGKLVEVPEPIKKEIPEIWLKVGSKTGQSGTLVVWSKIDRCMWKSGLVIIQHSEFLIGRMYRQFLAKEQVRIRFVTFDLLGLGFPTNEGFAKPNDPGYLMENTSCPEPFANKAMFKMWGKPVEFIIKFRGQEHKVKITFSYAKEEAREGYNPGDKPHGKHAARNIGVSIMRAGRELDLDPSWSNPSEPRDRWWGVELDFPPGLDDLFGVTNNKQSARNFSELAKVDLETLLEDGQTLGSTLSILEADQDPRLPLLEIAHRIRTNLNAIRGLIKSQTANQPRKRYEGESVESKATEVTEKRKKEGYTGESDLQEKQPAEEREKEIVDVLVGSGVTQKDAEELAAVTIGRGFKYTFAVSDVDSQSFFDVVSRGGSIIISLNSKHAAYDHLIEILEEDSEGDDSVELRNRLAKARDGLKLLLSAWARYEDEQPDGPRRMKVKEARWEWGKMAYQFLDGNE
jgi:hypothetical protein